MEPMQKMHLKTGLTLERTKFHNETTYHVKYSLIVGIIVRMFHYVPQLSKL